MSEPLVLRQVLCSQEVLSGELRSSIDSKLEWKVSHSLTGRLAISIFGRMSDPILLELQRA